ncbi:hypothetical protein BV898_00284 [Hypsibius exemplaris]|uniref:Attacin C-terminal domain-containing protein n=1 Tax=Hypsibius exemplaris TaxID=2072580 RepID=A0A1W0XFL2_HYPEX|nr:hypothetical protein BV898_00284 [Hypsibius exemplaris]
MAIVFSVFALFGSLFLNVNAASIYQLTGTLERHVRSFNQPMLFSQPQLQNSQQEGQNIRDSINIQKPVVNVNKNIGATSSSSISNAALISRPNAQGQGAPNLKLGQGLAVAISIQGPQGAATNDTFSNTQLFNTEAGDFGQSFANAGNTGPNSHSAQTGTNIHLQGNRNGFGTATSFNQANVNMFNAGRGGNGGRTGSASATGDVMGRR